MAVLYWRVAARDEFVPLPDAMKRLHEATLDSGTAQFAHGFGDTAENILNQYACCAAELGLPIYGCRPASSVRELIPLVDYRRGNTTGGALHLVPDLGTGGILFTNLAVKQRDLRRRWRKLVAEIMADDH